MWQDIVISFLIIALCYALLPQVIQGFVVKRSSGFNPQTLIINFISLYGLSVCFLTLGLTFAGIINLFTATLWLVLFVQHKIYKD